MTVAIICLAAPAASFAGPLAGWWPMNEGQGQTIYDWSGNGNNGMLGATPGVDPFDPVWTDGRFGAGRALYFDGASYVTVPRSPELEPNRITVSSWVREASTPGTYKYIVSKGGDDCNAGASYGLYTGAGGGIAFYIFDGTKIHVSPPAPQSVWNNTWHNAAGTFDGSKVRLYIDGKQVGSGTSVPAGTAISYTAGGGNGIGDYGNNDCNLDLIGNIDTVRIWNQALPIDLYWAIARSLFNR